MMKKFINRLFNIFKIKTYDLYIPFGRSCHCTMILQNENLRSFSQIFDWLIPDSYAIEPIEKRFELFNNLIPFFDIKDYDFKREIITNSGHYTAIQNKYNFEIGHDFKISKNDKENLRLFKIKYLRRWKRTWTNIKRSDKICFVYMINTWTQMDATSELNMDTVCNNIFLLRQKYLGKKIDFIIFEHSPEMKKGEIKTIKIAKGIIKYLSNHSYKVSEDKLSDIITIKKVLSNYKLSGKIKKDEIENH